MSFENPHFEDPDNSEDETNQESDTKTGSETLPTAEDLKKMNYYERLGLSGDETAEEIGKKFRRLSKDYFSPIDGADNEAYKYISEAYTYLKNAGKRKKTQAEWEDRFWKSNPKTKGKTSTGTAGSVPGSTIFASPGGGAYEKRKDSSADAYGNTERERKGKTAHTETSSSTFFSGSDWSYSTGTGKPPEPPQEKYDNKKRSGNFLTHFFRSFFNGIKDLFSNMNP